MKFKLFLLIYCFTLGGCSDKATYGYDRVFLDGPVVLMDKNGNEYLIKHHVGATYTVEKIPKDL